MINGPFRTRLRWMTPASAGGGSGGGGIEDAPTDGTKYGRKDGAWVAVNDGIIDGEVDVHASLPVTVGTPALGSVYNVKETTGSWIAFFTGGRKFSGLWRRISNDGDLDDWEHENHWPDVFSDDKFAVHDDGDATKRLAFALGGITPGNTRTLSVPDASGTIALTGAAPTAHAASHAAGQSDAIKLDDLAAPDDNTDLDATTSKHGLLPKLGGGTTNFLRADGAWAAPAGGGGERWDASFDGQGNVITAGISSFRHVAATATITQAALVADQSGSITITVKKYTPSGGALGSATTLGTIALSSAQHNRSTGLTWAVTAGDVIEFVTTATISTVTRVFVGLGT